MGPQRIALCLVAGLLHAGALSEQEAVALALSKNPDMLAARQGRVVAESRVAAAALLSSPEIRIGISDIVTDSNWLQRRENNVGLRWSPPRPGELGLKRGEARTEVREVAAAVATAEQKLAAEVRLLHRTIRLLDQQIAVAEEGVRLRRQVIEAVNAQVEAGVKSLLDRSSAELTLAEARALPERYGTERRIHVRRLLAKLGMPLTDPLEVRGDDDPLAPGDAPQPREALLTAAFAHRGELDALRARCERYAVTGRLARRERYPWISYVQVSRRFQVGDPSTWGFQLGVDLPVFHWGAATTGLLAAEMEQCRLQQHAVKATIANEIDELLLRIQAGRKELAWHREEIEAAGRAVEHASASAAAGESDLLEPLLARARQLNAKQAYIGRLIELRALEIGLRQATADPAQPSSSPPVPPPYTASE